MMGSSLRTSLAAILGWIERLGLLRRESRDRSVERPVHTREERDRRRRARFLRARELASAGYPPLEIARQTRLSREALTLLLREGAPRQDDSAGSGRFFRILHSRLAR